ncbi:class I glutamine amidotransferase-like protein [Dothidotthia symphoricarpi CBS 119687]|uniref:Class I glutamine amidotransferase-like protein n=1 Tax=Dothidotthia symphoricarpi CBS 119687 TaxID=1392245 RepID=A0A6A6A872_9PLEO|nr:class I glutamine amidotransferase-like protein [Dothidotthia symphoricarpi CBS 119687]KAF2127017.1 class I glutamine amidotransferase-like protein [Dothidotthia symphoricarpi CBS 119687]
MSQTIRICMLNADIPVPNVFAQRAPTYGRIFHGLIRDAALRVAPNVTIQSVDYDVRSGEYPAGLDEFDSIAVTGSASSTYDDLEWIRRLDQYLLDVYFNHPRIKMFGSCFGHQLICQSLLREYGARVESDPNGWELGVQEVTLKKRFHDAMNLHWRFDRLKDMPEKMRLQFVHHDHVVIPSLNTLPNSWMTLGYTKHCAIQGVYQPGRVLTFQGHFEFDKFVNSETIKFFFAPWKKEEVERILETVDADDDSLAAAEIVLSFLLEKNTGSSAASYSIADGLLTPPLSG